MVFTGPSVLLAERRVLKMLTRYHYFVISILISTQEKNPLKTMVFRLCFGTYI